jgi:hypothetical protein
MSNEHWSKRLHDVLEANEKPSYDLLEESVAALLEERQAMTATVTDMAKKFSRIVFERLQGNTDAALALLDEVIAKNVTVTVEQPPATPH